MNWFRKWLGPQPSNSANAYQGVAAGRDIRDSTIHIGLDEAAIEHRLAKMQQGVTDQLAQLSSQVARDRGVPAAPLRAVLVKLGEADFPDDDIPARLNAAADQLIELRKRLRKNYSSSGLQASGKQALALVDRGDLIGARVALSRGRTNARAPGKKAATEEARVLCDEAELDFLQLEYRAAAAKYSEAAALVAPFDGERRRELLNQQARALASYGHEFGDKKAIEEAIALHRYIDQNTPRDTEIVGWIGNKINFSGALRDLSRYEPQNASLLEEAISNYRELLKELPADFPPWKMPRALAKASLGAVLSDSTDPMRLREAIAALREAAPDLASFDKADWAQAQISLGNCLLGLADIERSIDLLREATSAYLEGLKVYSRNRFPRDWARAHVNLGNVYFAHADHDGTTEYLGKAIVEYRQALSGDFAFV